MSALFNAGFVVRVPSWHRLENTIFDEYPGREVAYLAAGHDFTVTEFDNGDVLDPITSEEWAALKADPNVPVVRKGGKWYRFSENTKKKGLRVNHERADGTLGPLHGKRLEVVNRTYEPIQNSVPWDVLDSILSDETINKGLALKYETGGVLEDGASCFVTAYLDHPFQIPGDDSAVYPYLFATWRHDSAGALNIGGTDVRIVCANTRGAAEDQANRMGRMFTFKHTRNVHERIADAKMALKGIMVEHNAFEELALELAAIELTPKMRAEFVARFVPYPSAALDKNMQVSDRVAKNIEEARAAVITALNSRSVPEAHKYTGWGAYNAATEYLDHLRPGKGGSKIENNPTSYVKRTLLAPNAAKDVIVPLIKDVAGIAA